MKDLRLVSLPPLKLANILSRMWEMFVVYIDRIKNLHMDKGIVNFIVMQGIVSFSRVSIHAPRFLCGQLII